jgi:hypothetical protein
LRAAQARSNAHVCPQKLARRGRSAPSQFPSQSAWVPRVSGLAYIALTSSSATPGSTKYAESRSLGVEGRRFKSCHPDQIGIVVRSRGWALPNAVDRGPNSIDGRAPPDHLQRCRPVQLTPYTPIPHAAGGRRQTARRIGRYTPGLLGAPEPYRSAAVYGWWHLLQTGADSASVRPLVQIRYGHAHNASNFPVPLLGLGGAGGRCRRGKPAVGAALTDLTRPEFAAEMCSFSILPGGGDPAHTSLVRFACRNKPCWGQSADSESRHRSENAGQRRLQLWLVLQFSRVNHTAWSWGSTGRRFKSCQPDRTR